MAKYNPLAKLATLAKLAKYTLLGQTLYHLDKYNKYIYINSLYILGHSWPEKERGACCSLPLSNLGGGSVSDCDITQKIHTEIDFFSTISAPFAPKRLIEPQIVGQRKKHIFKGNYMGIIFDVAKTVAKTLEKAVLF